MAGSDAADEIAALCYGHYRTKLSKQGQPDTSKEWTLMAAVIQVECAAGKKVVAMGTGTKCIGQSKLRTTGDVLQDSHAEIIAKRSFQRCKNVSGLPEGFHVHVPRILQSRLQFQHGRDALRKADDARKLGPCGAAISWCAVPHQPLDVTANGYRQGTTKKAIGTPQSRSRICKVELFHMFRHLLENLSEEQIPESLRELKTYGDYKEAARSYQEAWRLLREQVLTSWIRTSRDYLNFS
ncbi:tRNA-specific adenosine deaminase 1 isoform X6 [Bufo bufo]|uniref:tRNA-specific adenosine deaminase 1 isoform X6 n=1 Tax=Bufo bufo TaxID=8384 RepID=UPI001ABE28E0|nr:tRNA-specific adenosine deaminase 1 isoform X6 [Bufo bufo]